MGAIHAYEGRAGTIIPNIKLNVSWKGDRPTEEDMVNIGVQGVIDFNSFNLPCKAFHSPVSSQPALSRSIDTTFDRRNEEVKELARGNGRDENALNSKVTDKHLLEIKEFISWKEVGPHLKGISVGDINDIDRDGEDQADKRRMLLNLWEEKNYGHDATYLNLIMAMLKASKRNEAEKVCLLLPIRSVT